jgi:hypothetical protein
LPPTLADVLNRMVGPALGRLPAHMDTPAARVMLLAIGLQESRFLYRRQLGDGPARGYWQFERGTKSSRGGVWGVYLHRASSELLRLLCRDRDVAFDPGPIWQQIEHDDVLAAGVARLLLWTHPKALPAVGETYRAWHYYLETWRPGKPHPLTWPALYAQAVRAVADAAGEAL